MTEEYINKTREAVNFLAHIYSEDVIACDIERQCAETITGGA